ncbi:MAG: hypothetical protein Q8Q09_00655 [Deltaproteobacteria bacterium]|nr:hypothetical protein [Deltaproteobacteria bacterium]
MSTHKQHARRWPWVLLLATGSCFSVGPVCNGFRVPCSGSSVCAAFEPAAVDTDAPDFEGLCPGAACPAVVDRGMLTTAPSIHPAERALAIAGGTIATITVRTSEPADGARVVGLLRCDPGGSLRLLGDVRSELRMPLASGASWSAFESTVRSPTRNFVSSNEATLQRALTTVRFENTGAAPCFLARFQYETLASVCSRFSCINDPPAVDARADVSDASADTARPPRDGGIDGTANGADRDVIDEPTEDARDFDAHEGSVDADDP